jgi:hypothetical protein
VDDPTTGRQANVGRSAPFESGFVGCDAGDASGVSVNSHFVWPGSTMAKGRNIASYYEVTDPTQVLDPQLPPAPNGCLSGNIAIGGGGCPGGAWVQSIDPTVYYAETNWLALDPTALGNIRGSVSGANGAWGESNTYYTVDYLTR